MYSNESNEVNWTNRRKKAEDSKGVMEWRKKNEPVYHIWKEHTRIKIEL
jgi:hypothetical protein